MATTPSVPTPGSGTDFGIKSDYLKAFFGHVHVKNSILDESHVRAAFTHMTMNEADWSSETCLLLLILANGCLATPFGQSTS